MRTKHNPGGRPRKYKDDAERARAFRDRWGTVNVRVEKRTADAIETMRAVADFSQSDIVNAAIKFYATNFDGWRSGLIFGGRMPTVVDKATRERLEREAANRKLLESEG